MAFSMSILWVLAALVVYSIFQKLRNRNKPNLPPGPKPLPFIGNINDFPPPGKLEYEHWLEHKDKYGPISSVTVMGMTLITIHDKQMAHDLLDQMATKTAGRPEMIMANKLCGYESIVVCQSYTPTFRRYRKFLHQELGTKASAAQFHGVQEAEVNRQLIRGLKEPEEWISHLRTTAAATVLKTAYGYTIDPNKPDVLAKLIDRVMINFSHAAVPMAWMVDVIPALRFLPDGIPGIKFKETARQWHKTVHDSAYLPYSFVRRQMTSLANQPSYVSKLVQKLAPSGDGKLSADDEHAVVWSATSLYGAATDTTASTLTCFIAAMILFPEVQKKAQAEIDRVVGTGRLPNMSDYENLPYVNAIVKETLRWWPIAPMAMPHTATEEFEFNGVLIPKNAVIQPALWWFLHDPEVYASPECFEPERFLAPRDEPDPGSVVFGYGRRTCPGRIFADSAMFLNIAKTLAAFNLRQAVDEDGREIELDVRPKPGVLMHPTEFAYRVTPRSEDHVKLIEKMEREQPFEKGDAELLDGVGFAAK